MAKSGRPTINDVAALANVSKKTVSRVINKSPALSDKTRAHVEKIIAEIGFVPNLQARALALSRNFIIAVIHDNPNAQFLVNVQQGVLEALSGTEYGLMVQPFDRKLPSFEENVREFLERQKPYGVVMLPPISGDDPIAQLCHEFGSRFIRMGSIQMDKPAYVVSSNDREAVREAVTYLVEKGHKRIALIEGPEGFTSPRERRAGCEEALAKAGLHLDPALVRSGNYTFETGVEAAKQLLELDEPPTAIFACNDEMAIGAMIACRRAGLTVPDDMSVVGFDDTPLSSHVWPALTTVHWPIAEMARLAAQKIIAPIDDASNQEWLLHSHLIERGSVAAPRGA
jgi:LacI family transcriptional regulator